MIEEGTLPPDSGEAAPLAGERLAAARVARDISIHDIARQLHLDEHKVRALELNNFEILGAPVFTKGYLKKYAELVGISVDDILADYHRLNNTASTPLVIRHREPPPREISPGPWLGGLAAVALVAGAAWWWLSSGSPWFGDAMAPPRPAPIADETTAEAPPPASREPGTTPEAAGDVEGTEVSESVASSPPPPDDAAEVQSARETGAPGQGDVELRLTFSGDCWTEVTDASGDRLYFGLGSAGRSVTVTGEAPLQVLLGDSANATLAVNGSSYPVPGSARRGDTARLTITDL